MRRSIVALGLFSTLLCAPRAADAFCGFYVSGGGAEMFNNATQVVLMRMGTRTVLSMQNNYQGPPGAFAMVVPVPVVLQEDNVKTLDASVFARVDRMSAPRLVEYWEQDPCPKPMPDYPYPMAVESSMAPVEDGAVDEDEGLGVTVEAQFKVGEYEIVILSAKESTGLDTWLRQEKYNIPEGAQPLLEPYVQGGMKFFVAKVDPEKVRFADGMAMLSPLRFHYDTETFALPIRLGLMNSSGTQDLIVHILSPGQRYELANYENVTIPTNLDVKDEVRKRFGEFYAALFDATLDKNRGAVVTEYAWDASTCDPCPEPPLEYGELMTLGADVLGGSSAAAPQPYSGNFVLTRLHARYGKDGAPDDLVFRAAPPIFGGREVHNDQGRLENGASPGPYNNFQGRYAIRHEWTGPIACSNPRRGVWGGPPAGVAQPGIEPATNLAFAPRGQASLAAMVASDVAELGVKSEEPASYQYPGGAPKGARGCGCELPGGRGSTGAGGALVVCLVGAGLWLRRRRAT